MWFFETYAKILDIVSIKITDLLRINTFWYMSRLSGFCVITYRSYTLLEMVYFSPPSKVTLHKECIVIHTSLLCSITYTSQSNRTFQTVLVKFVYWACECSSVTTWRSLALPAWLLQLQLQGQSLVDVLSGRLTRWSSIMLVSLWRITANQFVLYQSVPVIRWRFYCGTRRSQMTRLSKCLITCGNSCGNVCATQK